MEAEKRVAEEVVESGPRTIPVVSELRMGAVAGDAKRLPLRDVRFGYVLLIVSVDFNVLIRNGRALKYLASASLPTIAASSLIA